MSHQRAPVKSLTEPFETLNARKCDGTICDMKKNALPAGKLAVVYLRVSTDKQGLNGLGMDAQRAMVAQLITARAMTVVEEFAEVESGKRSDRPQLTNAIALCRRSKATLVIAKLDRLARNAAFVLNLRDSGVDFVACDMPDANKLTIGIMALIAEQEREWISERTAAGLAAAKRRGTKIGNPRIAAARKLAVAANRKQADAFALSLADAVRGIEQTGVTSLRGMAECLNRRGFTTPRGKQFQATSVKNLLHRIS